MKIRSFIVSLLATGALVVLLNSQMGQIPPIGKLLNPTKGFWTNTDIKKDTSGLPEYFTGLHDQVKIYYDNRMIPHVFAQNEEDIYFAQGYLHAKFRLWQMEFQVLVAAGRTSEILGNDPAYLSFDLEQRRLGITFAAENAVRAIDADPESKKYFDAYTKGVNTYIISLQTAEFPIEYKLLNYSPEPWSNYKTALFLKMLSRELSGYDRDIEFSNEKAIFGPEVMKKIYPDYPVLFAPMVEDGTSFVDASIKPIRPQNADSLYIGAATPINYKPTNIPNKANGSNGWVVNGTKTRSGYPILCNDPHLNLTLPSLWFEMQLTTPSMNTYGVSFPGCPSVIIGFNENVAFGFTNAQRDVKDYFKIQYNDRSKTKYRLNGEWVPVKQRIEYIKIRNKLTVVDTVRYTVFGPVIYDSSFSDSRNSPYAVAVRWTAHDSTNDGSMWFKLNRASNYSDYLTAIEKYSTPPQNILFACKADTIAIWQQGQFPLRWKDQGLYIMPGNTTDYMWQGYIPRDENPHVLNPVSGYIQASNQRPVDSTYPYFIPGTYISARSISIDNYLKNKQNITVDNMMELQTDYHNSIAAKVLPVLLANVLSDSLSLQEMGYLKLLMNWDYNEIPDSELPTMYQAWFHVLQYITWKDEFKLVKNKSIYPDESTFAELLLTDPTFSFIDDIETPQIETLSQQVTKSFRLAVNGIEGQKKAGQLKWGKNKKLKIPHILKLDAFSSNVLNVGGSENTINAIAGSHGPSWRMIVALGPTVEAVGIYPGGQSGNPASPHYSDFVNTWSEGMYYNLWLMKQDQVNDKRIIAKSLFLPK